MKIYAIWQLHKHDRNQFKIINLKLANSSFKCNIAAENWQPFHDNRVYATATYPDFYTIYDCEFGTIPQI